jgi:SAM-dependent methyltransferase
MNWQDKTIETYDRSARQLADYFSGIGPRTDDIEKALELAGSPTEARVLELGCGDGRDASEIIKRVAWYQGIDPSEGLLEIARQKVPQGNFVQTDALSFDYPTNIDVVYAFASLLHVNKDDMPVVFTKISASLKTGGIAFLSLKERPEYVEEVKQDEYGERMFYYYSTDLIKDLSGTAFRTMFEEHQSIGPVDWFNIALQKQ